tara:strand:- start:276 stop:635 length:360 start_codon:yes stop_codon:yes gene_type:complete
MKKILLLLFIFSPSLLMASERVFLSCKSDNGTKKLWIKIDRNKNNFWLFTQATITARENPYAGLEQDLKESPSRINGLDRTSLRYRYDYRTYICKTVTREVHINERKAFLKEFLEERKI